MDSNVIQFKCLWSILLITSFMCNGTFSDMGKMSSSQNHFSTSAQSHFNTKNNTRVIAQKGGLAILPCVVKLNSPATVSWIRRKDFQLLTVGLSTHSSDKRFLVEHTRHMGHWSLRIKSVREEDRGFYECQLSIYPTQSIFIELKVVEAVAEITGSPDLHIDEGSTLRLECKLKRATENPSFVFWYHDSKMVNYDLQDGFSVTSTTVNIPSTGVSSDGPFYTSSTSSNYKDKNTIASGSNNLSNVNNVSNSPSNVNSSSTSTSNRNSHPNGYSSSLASLMSAQHQSSYLLAPSTSFLTIQEVHFHHAGNYTCAPSNARPASITVHVLRDEKPAAMQHANRSVVDGETSNSSSGASSSASSASNTSSSGTRSTIYFRNLEFTKLLNAMLHNFCQQCKIPSLIWLPTIVALICAYHKIDR